MNYAEYIRKLVRGGIKCTMNAHRRIPIKDLSSSLEKRIVAALTDKEARAKIAEELHWEEAWGLQEKLDEDKKSQRPGGLIGGRYWPKPRRTDEHAGRS